MASGAKVVIGADVREVKPAIDSVVQSVRQGGADVSGAFQGWVGNTNAVATATEKLERQMKSFASEQRQQGRMAKFYASELVEMIPAAEGAKKALQGLMGLGIEGLAGGIGFGLALESVKLLALGFEQLGKTAREAFAAADKTVSKILDEWNKKAEQIRRALSVAIGGEGAGIRLDLAASLKAVNAEIEKAKASLESLMMPGTRADLQKQLDGLIEKRRAIVADAAEVYSTEKKITAVKEEQAAQAAAMQAAERERLRIAQEVVKAEQTIRDLFAKGWEQGEFPDMAFNQKTLDDMTFFKEKKAGDEAAQKLNQMQMSDWTKGEFPGISGEFDKIDKHAKSTWDLAEAGNAVASSFSDIGAAIGGTAGSIVQQIANIVMLTVKFIGLAIAASMASAAQTPIVGPWAAIAGGVAVAAAIVSLISGIVAPRAMGGPVSGMRPYLVGERGPELFVPGASGAIVPNDALGRGGGLNITINANDSASFEKMLRRRDNELFRVLREGQMAGRI